MRPKLSFANVVSVLALFVALGGSAYAFHLGKNSVGSKQLKKNAVVTAKVKNEAITGAKVKKGTLTGTQINLSTLGTVPTATNASSATNAINAINAQRAQTADAIQAPEALHLINAPSEPPFAPNWKNFAMGYAVAGFYKDREGVVHLQGTVEGNGTTSLVFTLPPGYRPAAYQPLPGIGNGVPTTVTVRESGEVISNNPEIVSLNGITFRAES
jgi:hypothetical protein